METEAEGLTFDGGARKGGLGGGRAEGDAAGSTARRDLGRFHREHGGDGGGRGVDGGGESRPVGVTTFATDGFTRERAVTDADEAHATTHRITESVTEAGRVGTDTFDRGEKRVARAETDDDLARLRGPHADEAGRIIAGPDDDLALRGETISGDEVSGDAAGHGRTRADRRKLGGEIGRGRGERGRRPITFANIHQVHARAIAGINRGILTSEHRREERRNEMDALRLGPSGRLEFGEAADLRASETLRGHGAGQVADGLVATEDGGNLGAFGRGG